MKLLLRLMKSQSNPSRDVLQRKEKNYTRINFHFYCHTLKKIRLLSKSIRNRKFILVYERFWFLQYFISEKKNWVKSLFYAICRTEVLCEKKNFSLPQISYSSSLFFFLQRQAKVVKNFTSTVKHRLWRIRQGHINVIFFLLSFFLQMWAPYGQRVNAMSNSIWFSFSF